VPLHIIPLLPNRVRRNYRGGYLLDQLDDRPVPGDGDRPEDWLASTVPAINPGLPSIPDEGLARVRANDDKIVPLRELFEKEPEFYLGERHVRRLGGQPGFLAKLLDSSMRLHVQAHPTAAFARKHLGSPWGKLETYVILALRDPATAYIRLGFQRPPSPREWKRIVLEQDIPAMDRCFDRIPVQVGEVWLVPGGLPHAIGEGILMLEVMEPSDLVVRCEFEREGVVVPPNARFMQSPVDLALQIFDYTPLTVEQVKKNYNITPQPFAPGEELLIGPAQTECFSITRLTVRGCQHLFSPGHLRIGLVAQGQGTLTVNNNRLALQAGSRFLLAAATTAGIIENSGEEPLQILFCSPGSDVKTQAPAVSLRS
jgi:mannose-6-phosphate isomerase